VSKKSILNLINENEDLRKLIEMVIPEGPYCYTFDGMIENEDGSRYPKTIPCPFWDKNEEKHYQECGYCHLLDSGDWEMNDEKEYTNVKTGKKQTANEIGLPLSLLWDQVKECGLSRGEDEFEDEDEGIQDGEN